MHGLLNLLDSRSVNSLQKLNLLDTVRQNEVNIQNIIVANFCIPQYGTLEQ